MSDLAKRLREDFAGCPFPRVYTTCNEAADEIDRLNAELAAMTAERDAAIADLRYWLPHESTVLIAERDALKAELARYEREDTIKANVNKMLTERAEKAEAELAAMTAERAALRIELAAARGDRDRLLRLASAYLLALDAESTALRDAHLAIGDPDEARPARHKMIEAQNNATAACLALKAALDAAREEGE